MVEARPPVMRTIPTTATTPSFGKRVRYVIFLVSSFTDLLVCVSDALVAEIKRIVKESEILKYVKSHRLTDLRLTLSREDDTKWPHKNKDGRQELEIRLGGEHISFEACSTLPSDVWTY